MKIFKKFKKTISWIFVALFQKNFWHFLFFWQWDFRQFFVIIRYSFRHPGKFYNALSDRAKKWALRVLVFLLIILIAVPVSIWLGSKKTEAAWWNDMWTYRKSIAVTNNTMVQSNVYISLTLDTSDATKFQADCGDLRFTNLSGDLMQYYVVSGCGTVSTVVHTLLDVFPAGAQTIYYYYGNATAINGFSAADFSTVASNYTIGSLGSEEKGTGPVAYWSFDEGQGTVARDNITSRGSVVSATGGTITTVDNYKYHTFTSADTFVPTTSGNVEVFTWGGGGAGGTVGGWTYGSYGGSGGAAEGKISVTAGALYPVVVGGGGVVNSYSSDFKCALGGGGCASNSNGDNRYCGGGGGYSGIFNSSVSQANALLIAGGGGGGGSVWSSNGTTTSQSGGAGGGSSGQIGYGETDVSYRGQPGTQTSAGATASGTYMYQNGNGAIQGALQGGTTNSYSYGGGGGGGYWGGSAGAYFTGGPYPVNQMQGGGGGSGYYNPTSVSSGILTAGSGTTPGDSNNSLRGSYGNAGGYQGNGAAGIVIVRYPITNDGTLTNMSSTPSPTSGWQTEDKCVAGKCLAFDGTDDYVNIPITPSLKPQSNLTLQAWVRPTLPYNGDIIILGQGAYYLTIQNDYSIQVYWYGKSPEGYHSSGAGAVVPNQWNLITAAWNDSTVKIYANGILKNTINTSGTASQAVNQVWIGAEASGTARQFRGSIDEPKIYNYARSAAQIKLDYNAGLAGTGGAEGAAVSLGGKSAKWMTDGLLGYWKMDEASGNAIDSSGNGNTGVETATTVVAGKFGNDRSFNGSTSHIVVDNTKFIHRTSNFSYAWWTKWTGTLQMASYFENGTWGNSLIIRQEDASYFQVYSMSTYIGHWAFAPTIGTWYNLALIRDGNYLYFYVNGEKIGDPLAFNIDVNPSANLWMGASQHAPTQCLNGQMDEARVYNRALQPQEIKNLYNYAPGPVGYWNMEEGSGTTANDTSGSGYTGTITGSTWTTGKFGKALNFSATNDKIQMASPVISGTGDFTFGAWINRAATGGVDSVISNYGTGGCSTGIEFYVAGDKIGTYISGGVNGATTINANTWYYVATTRTGGVVKVYVDGKEDGSGTLASSIGTNCNLAIGNGPNYTSEKFEGKIDDAKVYNYARTPDQIKEDMLGRAGSSVSDKSALGYWKFNEGYSTTANNSGSGGSTLNGTISGATWNNNGKFGKTLNFDGVDDYVEVPHSANLSPTDKISISVWIKPISSMGQYAVVVAKPIAGWTGGYGLTRDASTDNLSFWINSYTNKITIPFSYDQWQYVTATYDGATMKIFKNGALINSQSYSTAINQGTEVLRIGTPITYAYPFKGSIDEIKVYNYALTADEVALDYNHGSAMSMGDTSLNPSGNSQNSPGATCATIKTANPKSADGVYWIKPTGSTAAVQVYCDMTRDGGGWTLGVKSWYGSGMIGNINAVGAVADATSHKGNAYKLSDANIINIIGPTNNFDVMADQNGYNSAYSTGNYEYVIVRNYTGLWTYATAVPASTTTTVFQSYRASDNALAWTGNLGCGYNAGSGVAGINCVDVISNNPQGGAGCNINMGTASNEGWHHFFMNQYNDDTYLYICNGPQHSSSYDLNHRWWFRERSTTQSFTGDYPPVAEWKFEEGSGTTANDTSGNGYVGTITGATWTTGKIGKGLNFDGSGDYISAGTGANVSTGVTLEAWIYPTSLSGGYKTIISRRDGSGSQYQLYLNTGTGILRYYNGTEYTSAYTPTINTWTHVVATNNNGTLVLYANGVQVYTTTGVTIPVVTAGLYIGSIYTGGETFVGKIDEVKIYNYARTQAQIAWDYNRGGPIGWWKMDEGEGMTAHDSSGNNNSGTLTNMDPPNDWVAGKINTALDFDGSNDYIAATPPVSGMTQGTLACWVKFNTLGSDADTPIGIGNAGAGKWRIDVYPSGAVAADFWTDGNAASSAGVISTGNWYHLVSTFDGTTKRMFVNGVQIASAVSSATAVNASTVQISGYTTGGYIIDGQIDDARVYNYALTAEQVKQVYSGGAVSFK